MLYKIDKNGFVVNEAGLEKVQPYYRRILKEINELYNERLGDNLMSVYIRGSVSVGNAKPGISDIDSIAVTKKDLSRNNLLWIIKSSKKLGKKYPKAGFFDLTVVSLEELKNSRKYKNLRVYLKTQSFLLTGEDILSQLPDIVPGKELAVQLYGDLPDELEILKNIFAGKIKDREYLFQKKPIKFWCIWMTRVLIRAGLGNIKNKSLYDLITSEKFIKLRDRDKHSRNFLEKENSELAEEIFKILANKKFRAGALPAEDVKKLVLEKIERKVSENLPIRLFQFWGGCKNPNLPTDTAELCEEATLGNLQKINNEVVKIYNPGLKIFISPGDGRVQNVNRIPKEKTEKYVQTLTEVASKYNGLFSVVPISTLYKKYLADFEECLSKAKEDIEKDIYNQADFEKLILNARKNVFGSDLTTEEKILERSKEAAKDYIIYRVAEEEAKIFRDFDDCIRSFFIKYIPFYKKYIKNINETKPRLDCSLVFYTGRKGNITQPWQAIGKNGIDDEVLFLSQNRLKLQMDKS